MTTMRRERFKAFWHGYEAAKAGSDYPNFTARLYVEPTLWDAYRIGRQLGGLRRIVTIDTLWRLIK